MQLRASSAVQRAPVSFKRTLHASIVASACKSSSKAMHTTGSPAAEPQHQVTTLASLIRSVSVITAASLALATGLFYAPDEAYANELGRTVFNGNCAACHQGGRNSVAPEKTLDKAALEQYLAGGFKLEAIIYQINNGKGAMPAWQDRLDEEEIEAVAKYVYETAVAGGWDSK